MAHDFKLYPELTNNQMQFYFWDSPHAQITEDFEAKVVRVKDGDTIQVKTDFRDFEFPVRMFAINAAELDEGGNTSRDWLKQQIEGEEVTISIDPTNRVGKWGRLLGDVIHGGQSMSQLSLDTGHSIPFERSEANIWA